MDLALVRERFLKDGIPIRLGGIAANLARVKSFSNHSGHKEVTRGLIVETMALTEWCTPGTDPKLQAELSRLRSELASWEGDWDVVWDCPSRLAETAEAASKWSQYLLKVSGLLP